MSGSHAMLHWCLWTRCRVFPRCSSGCLSMLFHNWNLLMWNCICSLWLKGIVCFLSTLKWHGSRFDLDPWCSNSWILLFDVVYIYTKHLLFWSKWIFLFSDDGEIDISELGSKSCVTRFIKKMLSIVSVSLYIACISWYR